MAPATPNLLQVTRWWTIPMPMSSTLAWFRTHPPAGLQATGDGYIRDGQAQARSLSYGERPTTIYDQPKLLVLIAAAGADTSAIRLDAQTVWVPPRTGAETIPVTVARADLLAYRGAPTHPLARATLSGKAASRLARLVNDLTPDTGGPRSCAADFGVRVRMTFTAGGDTLVFTESPACSIVGVTANGHAEPALRDSTALANYLRTTLGLNELNVRS